MVWWPFSLFTRQAQNALQNANTIVLKNALRNYIKAVNKLNKNKLTNQEVTKILNNVNATSNNKRKIRNRLANGVARAIAVSRHAIPTAAGAAFATAALPNVAAGPSGNITETAAAKEVNNATKNVNRAYILNTILKRANLANNNAKVQAMINYNPKINFKSLIRTNNSPNIEKLFTMANTAANSKYGANRKKQNLTPSMPSKQTNAVNIPAGFFNENAAKKATNNATIEKAIAKANALNSKATQANIEAIVKLLQNANKLATNQATKTRIGNKIANLQRAALLKMPVNNSANRAAMTKKIGNYIWDERAWGGLFGLGVNINYPSIAGRIKANTRYNLSKTNKAALNAYLAGKTGYNQAHRNRAMAISNALFAAAGN
jgi:hypothetical protein